MKHYILAHDLGTSGNKATLFDENGNLIGSKTFQYQTISPALHFVEQDPNDWWIAVCKSSKSLLETHNILPHQICGVCLSGQMMGCVLIDRHKQPLRTAIIWADSRAIAQEKRLIKSIGEENGYSITGHRLSASYSAAKLLWIKENEPFIFKEAACMLNAKDYILLKLTDNCLTDYSDASGTNLFDLRKKAWSEDILSEAGIPSGLMPDIYPSTAIAGQITAAAASETGLSEGIPVVVGGGDGSCACVGAGAVSPGDIYNVIGTSSWISTISKDPLYDPQMRTFNWVHLDHSLYTPCGTMQAAGYSIKWMIDNIYASNDSHINNNTFDVYSEADSVIEKIPPGSGQTLFLPYLLGERSPRWNLQATACFLGIDHTTTRAHLQKSVLEGIGLNLKVILDILTTDNQSSQITVIGGCAKSRALLQILSDIWQKQLLVPLYLDEATSIGAAVCGGVGVGLFKDFQTAKLFNPAKTTLLPKEANQKVYSQLYDAFNKAYEALIPIYDSLSLQKEQNTVVGK